MTNLIPCSLEFDFSSLDRADIADSTRTKYKSAITAILLAGINIWDTDALIDYATALTLTGRSHLKSALKIITEGELNRIKAQATPDNIHAVQALVMRVEALHTTIHAPAPKGEQAHIWLSREQVEQITALPEKHSRDWVVLAALLGAGLRREELATLTWDSIKQQPSKNGMRTVLSITGKGAKRRVIPISKTLADGLNAYKHTGERVVELSAVSIWEIVNKYGRMIGLPDLSPHDLRRTYARLGYDAGVPLEQISKLLGHSSVQTTMRYLGIEIDLESSVSDFIPLS